MKNGKKTALFLGDITILYLSLALTILIGYSISEFKDQYLIHTGPFSALFALWLLVFYLSDLYKYSALRTNIHLGKTLLRGIMLSVVASVIALYLFPDFFKLTPKTNLAILSILFFGLSYIFRIIILQAFISSARRIIIFGNSPLIEETVSFILENPQSGYKIELWTKNPDEKSMIDLSKTVGESGAHLLVMSPELMKNFQFTGSAYKLFPLEVKVMNFLDFYEEFFEKVPLDSLNSSWFIEHISTHRPFYDAAKRILDFSLALIFGVILLPLIILISISIAITSRGPVLFIQKRIGKAEKEFTLFKFRTMTHGNTGPLWTEKNDSRITGIGKFLRFTHFDEFPQLWNILKGDISFTGPRPERAELVEKYNSFPHYGMRHVIKPGVSGWAQINYKPSASLEEAYEKLKYDIYYVKNRSLLLDFLIIIKTIRYIFSSHS